MTNLEHLTVTENHFHDFALVSGTSNDSDYPAGNLNDFPLSKTTRSAAGITDATWSWDLLSPKAADLFVIGNHNLSATASVLLRGGNSPTPDGSQFEVAISWREHDMFATFATETWRYWAVVFSDPDNEDGFIEQGYEMIGERTELDTGFEWGWRRIHESINTTKKTEMGARHASNRYKTKRFFLDFGGLDRDEALALADFLDDLDLDVVPLWIMLNQDDTDEGYFVNLVSNPAELREPAVRISGLEFEELSRGFKIRIL